MEETRNISREWFTKEIMRMGRDEESKERMTREICSFLEVAWMEARGNVLDIASNMAMTGIGDFDFDDLTDGIEQCLKIRRLAIWMEAEYPQVNEDKEGTKQE